MTTLHAKLAAQYPAHIVQLQHTSKTALTRENLEGLVIHSGQEIKAFLDDTFYDFQVICYRREVIKTKAGSFKSVVFRPVMPENSIFEGEDAVLAWISDDENKIPLKVEAEMFIGHAGIELTSFSGLRNKPALVDN